MNPKMKSAIEKITLNDATFSNEVIEPTYVNFFYGKNGAGKSTIARTFKANDERLQWQAGKASTDYDVLVYDTDFINANLRNYGNLAGVFTVNETNIAIQEQVDTLNAERKKMGEEYNGHKAAIDQKTADKNTALSTFQSDCWSKSAEARTLFDEAIKGKKKAALFAQEILAITPVAHDVEDLKTLWIGNMPSHWEVIRGKYILRYMQKPVRDDDGVITCFRDGEVTLRSNRREDGFTMSDKEIGYQGIDIGDLVVHGMDGFAGAIGISDSRGKASPVLNVLDTNQNKRYIMYYLRSMAYSDVFLALATGIRVRSCDLRWNKLADLSYPVPPLDEQKAIVEHVDAVLAKADDVISDKKEQLATLDEYKKSLIFEYVTGKKEVV